MIRLVISCSNDTTIKIWNMPDSPSENPLRSSTRPVETLTHNNDYVRSMTFSDYTGALYSASDDGYLKMFDLNVLRKTKEERIEMLEQHSSDMTRFSDKLINSLEVTHGGNIIGLAFTTPTP